MATPTPAPDPTPAPTAAPEPTRVDVTALLRSAIALGQAHDGTAVSTRHLALSELVRSYRALALADRLQLLERFGLVEAVVAEVKP